MLKYENYECPVCKTKFEEGDDIVTCPDCGTPHHRECYKLIGKCVNNGLHKSGYEFGKDAQPVAEETANEPPQQEPSATVTPLFIPPVPNIEEQYAKSEGKINDKEIGDIAAVVKVNVPRFVMKFRSMEKTKKKTGWNWGAFFFGSFYYLFRKMYKQGIILLCLITAVFFGASALQYKLAPDYMNAMNSAVAEYSQNAGDSILPDSNAVMEMYNSVLSNIDGATLQTLNYIAYGFLAILLIIRVLEAMFADSIYMKTVTDIIDKVDTQLNENDMAFMQSPIIMQSQPPLSQEQMRKMYLSRKGGVSLFGPAMAMLGISILRMFL